MSKKELKRNFILLLSLLFVFIAAAVAWFVAFSRGNLDRTEFESVDAIKSQIDTSGGYYDGEDLTGFKVILKPSSGLGNTDETGRAELYTPVIAPFTEAEPIEGAWTRAPGKEDAVIDFAHRTAYISYIDYYSIIKSNHQAKLALSSQSRVVPVVADYNGTDPDRPERDVNSKYGEFSVDNIAGAVRVAFILCTPDNAQDVLGELMFDNMGRLCNISAYDENGEPDELDPIPFSEQLMMIWIPNDRYELTELFSDVSGSGTMVLTGAQFTTDGQPEPAYYYFTGSQKAQYPSGIFCTDSMMRSAGYSVIADSIWQNTANGNYFACVKIRIWIEGYDREASVALEGGMFDSEIYLLTIQEAS